MVHAATDTDILDPHDPADDGQTTMGSDGVVAAGDPQGSSDRARTALVVGGLTTLAAGIPLAVALVVLRDPHWYPALDLAQTELRVRDVGSSHPPLIGLAGRFFGFGQRGSHPGPLSFWSLWPFYTLLGSSAWAMQAATGILNLLATAAAIWIGHRRGGLRLALAVAVVMAVLVQAYTTERLTEAWNPFLPPMWWVVFLLAVWSVLCDDLPMLPVAVFAGSFCAQTHISYVGLVGALGAVAVLVVGGRALRSRPDRPDRHLDRPDRGGDGDRGRAARLLWGGAALGLLLVLWLPPIIEQRTEDLGNVGLLKENFSHPGEEQVSWGDGLEVWLAHLDVRGLYRIEGALTISLAPHGSPVPGLVLLAAWIAAAVVTWGRRRHHPALWRLHVTVGLAAAVGLVSLSRVLGDLWDYLMLWAWGTTALMLLAILLSVPVVGARLGVDRRSSTPGPGSAAIDVGPDDPPRRVGRGPFGLGRSGERRQAAVLLAALAVVVAVATYDAAYAQPPNVYESKVLTTFVPAVTDALQQGRLPDGTPVPGGGADGRYLVRWGDNDLATPGGGFGLLLELERAGLEVGGIAQEAATIVPHRVLDLTEATATVNHVVGDAAIADWRARPGAVEVVYVDPRTPPQRRRFAELHDQVVAELQVRGLDELADGMEGNVLAVSMDDRMPLDLEVKTSEMLEIGAPAAVFVAPPEAG
jgi:hypothetical protein